MPHPEQMGISPMPERPVNIEAAYDKAKKLAKTEALVLESFLHEDESGSNRPTIEHDRKYVTGRMAGMDNLEKQEYKLAKALEAALHDRVNHDKWFGERARMIMPTDYDDLKNGIDGIVEFHEKQGARSYLGLALDVTYNHDPAKKFEIIKEQIDQGRLGLVKYFRSTDNTVEGKLKNVPRAVVALGQGDSGRMVRDWQEGKPAEDTDIRRLILYQLLMQLHTFQAYAAYLEKQDSNRPKLSSHFEGAKRNVTILLSGIATPEQMKKVNQHPSVRVVYENLKQFEVPKE